MRLLLCEIDSLMSMSRAAGNDMSEEIFYWPRPENQELKFYIEKWALLCIFGNL